MRRLTTEGSNIRATGLDFEATAPNIVILIMPSHAQCNISRLLRLAFMRNLLVSKRQNRKRTSAKTLNDGLFLS